MSERDIVADLRSQANIASRAGQFDALNEIADRVAAALDDRDATDRGGAGCRRDPRESGAPGGVGMTRIYIAGPMTGLAEFNYPAFQVAATKLRAVGFDVEDPSTNENPTPSDYHGWLRAGLAQLIRCDAVALLAGWEASGGARLEVNVGATLGMRVAPLAEWIERSADT